MQPFQPSQPSQPSQRSNRFLPVLLAALSLTLPVCLGATTLLPVEAAGLVDGAQLIFVGTALRSEPALTGDGRFPFTLVTFRVERTLKGSSEGAELTLAFPGGSLGGDRFIHVEGTPEFDPEGEYLLFVKGNGAREFPIVGWAQGRFDLRRDPATGRSFFLDRQGKALLGLQDGRWQRTAEPIEGDARKADEAGVEVLWSDGAEVTPIVPSQAKSAEAKPAAAGQILRSLEALIRSRTAAHKQAKLRMVHSAQAKDLPLSLSAQAVVAP